MKRFNWLMFAACCLALHWGPQNLPAQSQLNAPGQLKVLFLGDNGHHEPRLRFVMLEPAMAKRNIELTYTDKITDLNDENLAKFDAVLLYANIDTIDPPEEAALLKYVNDGGGFVPLHCASYCFRNSDALVALMGAQFKRHGTGVFRTTIENSDHPIMKGFGGFESWDETYVHDLHNEKDRTVLAWRIDGEGKEPWTWVRTQGQGRVFYTAWGHDDRTWKNPGFQNLVERGIRWAAKDDLTVVPDFLEERPFPVPKMTSKRTDVKPFEYMDAGSKIPNYTPGQQWGVQGEPFTKMQKPLPPEESIKHFVVPEKFRVKLFASEPDIGGKPIAMAWDERGRLWVAETYDYPNELQPEGQGRDRIRILEDTDGDWIADKFTVFADKLSIPTSIAFYRGGAIVQDGTRTLYLQDTDGDDVADQRQVLFTGWRQNDTHGGVSNFQYGLDNWIWAMQGYNDSTPTINGEKQQTFRMGFFRFRPDGSAIEFIRSTDNNTWGLGISEEGLIFGSTANRNPSVYMPIANRYYERVRGWAKNLQLGSIADTHLFKPITENIRQVDHHGGYTAAAGHALYTARQYPQEYWNRVAFVNGPTGHLVGSFVLTGQGADFKSTSPFNLIASDDEWTAPIMTEIGPDGNAWVIDWYNYIVQHNPTPKGFESGRGNAYETPLRDKKYGRIYRVVYGEGTAKPFSLKDAPPEKLVDTLKHPTMLWRKHAQRLLVERGKTDVVPQLIRLINDPSVDEIGLNVGVIHAIWTLHGLGQLDGSHEDAFQAVILPLQHPSAGVRRNALQALPAIAESTDAVVKLKLVQDKDPQVRLAALLALADLPPSAAAASQILRANFDGYVEDRWLRDGLIIAAANQGSAFLVAASTEKRKATDALDETLRIVAGHFARGRSDQDRETAAILKAIASGNPDTWRPIIEGLSGGWPDGVRPEVNDQLDSDLGTLMKELPETERGVLIQLSRRWGMDRFEDMARDVQKSYLRQLDDEKAEVKTRIVAAEKAIEFMPNEAVTVVDVLKRITPQTEPELAIGILNALRNSQSAAVGTEIIKLMDGLSPNLRTNAIRLLLAKNETTGSLLDGVEAGKIPISELALDQVQGLINNANQPIRRRARQLMREGGAIPDADRQKVLQSMMALSEEKGDATNGKAVFKKICANCHMHSGEGQRIGPDLTGMSVHPKSEMLVHILDPNRDVEANFRMYKIQTTDGLLINGLLSAESKTSLELFDTEGKKHVILREDIEQLSASAKSVMPEGFEKQINTDQMKDLLEFLAARGKYVPLNIGKAATIASDAGMFYDRKNMGERMVLDDWSTRKFKDVPFNFIDPNGGRNPNVIMLNGPIGDVSRTMPSSTKLTCNLPCKAIHLLSGISGWGFPFPAAGGKSVSMIVRLHYADGTSEDHELVNGVHFADYIRRIDVPESEFAFDVGGHQLRYLAITPKRAEPLKEIEFIKGPDQTAPIVMAVTVEAGELKIEN